MSKRNYNGVKEISRSRRNYKGQNKLQGVEEITRGRSNYKEKNKFQVVEKIINGVKEITNRVEEIARVENRLNGVEEI